jgi:agmatine/peptidylarginine deiminase
MSQTGFRLPAEWERQSATLLAWPSADSDWAGRLDAIRDEYRSLVEAVLSRQTVVLLVPPNEPRPTGLDCGHPGLRIVPVPYDDTWCRDYGPIVLVTSGRRLALDFHFDGWGGKYPAGLDNRVNGRLAGHEAFGDIRFRPVLFELEGGAIDADGDGRVLINRHCLRARHGHLDDDGIARELCEALDLDDILAIDLEPMTGDDTDGHIDTLARFAAADHIVYQRQRDPARNGRLHEQLAALATRAGTPYRLTALPVPDDLPDGPASYANFVLVNDACLVPAYGSARDDEALDCLAGVFPERSVQAVPAATMITQSGGPHCASMHIPAAPP